MDLNCLNRIARMYARMYSYGGRLSLYFEDMIQEGLIAGINACKKCTESICREDKCGYIHICIRRSIISELRKQTCYHKWDKTMPKFVSLSKIKILPKDCSVTIDLEKCIKTLDKRTMEIIQSRYFKGHKFQDIAARFKVDPTRISQLHTVGLKKLRACLEEYVQNC